MHGLHEFVDVAPKSDAIHVAKDCDSDTIFQYDLAYALHDVLLLTLTQKLPDTKGLAPDADNWWALRNLSDIEKFIGRPELDVSKFRMLVEIVRLPSSTTICRLPTSLSTT